MIKNPKLLNLMPEPVFKSLLTTNIINPESSLKKSGNMTALDKKIKTLTERKRRGKLSKK